MQPYELPTYTHQARVHAGRITAIERVLLDDPFHGQESAIRLHFDSGFVDVHTTYMIWNQPEPGGWYVSYRGIDQYRTNEEFQSEFLKEEK